MTGLLLVLLGAWGGLIAFIGPYFHYAYTPDSAWTYTSGRDRKSTRLNSSHRL